MMVQKLCDLALMNKDREMIEETDLDNIINQFA